MQKGEIKEGNSCTIYIYFYFFALDKKKSGKDKKKDQKIEKDISIEKNRYGCFVLNLLLYFDTNI